MSTKTLRSVVLCISTATLAFAASRVLEAQAAKGSPPKDAPPPPVTYHGLIPGVSSVEEVRAKLGEPAFEASWYAWKMLYSVAGRPDRFDALHIEGGRQKGKVGTIEAVSVPEGFASRDEVIAKLGEPEFHLTLRFGQEILDYSEKGVRFSVDERGRTTGVAYFPHGHRRVHEGERRRINLQPRSDQATTRPAQGGERDPGIDVGTAEIDLSPFPGMLREEFKVHDPLKARCAVFVRDDLKVAVVGADLFGMLKSEIDPIEKRLREKGIDHLLFAMSHNHAAPDTIGIYGFYPEMHVQRIQEQVYQCVLSAAAKTERVRELVCGVRELPLEGARVPGLFRNARNPGIVDPAMTVVEARGEGGKPLATIVHFACHVEGLEDGPKDISADFPGYMCDRLREQRGAQAIFLNGAVGGMVSGDTRARTHEEAKRAGERLADLAVDVAGSAEPYETLTLDIFPVDSGLPLSFDRRRLEIPVTNARFNLFQKISGNRRPWKQGRVVTELFVFRLCDVTMLTVPGEVLPELSFEILEHMGGCVPMIVGLANDELGYIIPAYDFRADAYEESMSVGPAAGPLVKECALRLLKGEERPK
jgi:hypothetical protein